MVRRSSIAVAAAILGCQTDPEVDDLPPPARFAPLCGEHGPIQLLSLEEDEQASRPLALWPYDDRLVHVIGVHSNEGETLRIDVRSTGMCGEDPRILFEDVSGVETRRGFTQPLLCDKLGRALLASADGAPPHVLFENTGCEAWAIGSGAVGLIVHEGGNTADIVVRESLTAPLEPLAQRIVGPQLMTRPVAVTETEVFFVRADDDRLVALDGSDRSETVLAEEVGGFDISPDGNVVLIQSNEPFTQGVDSYPIELLDRQTGERVELGWGDLAADFEWLHEGFAWAFADPALGGPRVVLLPELEPLLLGQGRYPLARLSEEWLAIAAWDEMGQGLMVFDLDTREDVAAFPGGQWMSERDHGFDVFAGGALLHWDPATSKTGYIATVVRGFQRVSEHRLVVQAHPNDAAADALVLMDQRTGEVRLVDRDGQLRGHLSSSTDGPLGGGTVAYEVPQEGRKGVWAARLDSSEPRRR
jgi:hypothetical protein